MKCMFGSAAPAPPAEHLMAPCKPSQAFLFQPGHWEGFEEAWSSPSPCAVGMGSPPARSCCQTGGGFGHPWKGARGQGRYGVSVPKGISIPLHSSEQASAQKWAEPCTFRGFPGRIQLLQAVGRAEATPCLHWLGTAHSRGFEDRVQVSLPHWQQHGFLDEASSISIILPAPEMPKSLGSLYHAQSGSGL